MSQPNNPQQVHQGPLPVDSEMLRPVTWYFEDFEEGQVFRTQGRTITESDLVMFAGWSWDTNPLHTDAAYSATQRFEAPIAHGLLGMSVAMGLAARLGVFESCSVALLGVDRWRFLRPILVGDTVTCEVAITSTRPTSRGDAGVLDREFRLFNQNHALVQQGSIGLLVARHPTS
ncbi:MAG TPA: MaoC/PaaZ C-terminal domain-containing protein [Nocardioidaceae bacterium]|nr:MaoC/PaaZ C-terminal domain-containing protein [Nocardioidaceae bacterium]